MTRAQQVVRYKWFRRVGWVAIFALGFQTAAPAAEAGLRTAVRRYHAWQSLHNQQSTAPPDVRVLRKSEMLALKGRGRIPSLAGQAKWDIIDNGVNLRTRNYTYTATDLTLPGAIGIPVSVVRTWNANDNREGPFGIGWSWSLDVRQAAGGLVKRKTAPDRTVPTSVNNGRNLTIKQAIRRGRDLPSFETVQVDGVACQDLSGEQWIAWRDADGLYTPPPWDHNEYESTYKTILYTRNGIEYARDYALSTKVTTPDGTVYYYEAVTQSNDSPVVFDAQGNEAYTEQVLKWVKDRHGNTTTYDYTFVDNVEHIYWAPNDTNPRTITVRKAFVRTITNASGFKLTVQWNFDNGGGYVNGVLKHPRVTSIASSDGREVKYWYGPADNERGSPQDWAGSVTAVENNGGILTARYRYDSWSVLNEYCGYLNNAGISCEENNLLVRIIDADGATTTITYNTGVRSYEDSQFYAVAVRRVTLPSGVVYEYPYPSVVLAIFDGRWCVERSVSFLENDNTVTVFESALYPRNQGGSFSDLRRIRRYNRLWQWLEAETWIKPGFATGAVTRQWCIGNDNDPDPDSIFGSLPSFALDALREDVRTLPILWMQELITGMTVGNLSFVTTTYQYNCLGQPTQVRTVARSWHQGRRQDVVDIDQTRTITYHGKDYYYQKASETTTVRGQARTKRYFYFDRNDPRPGYRGQLHAVQYTVRKGNATLFSALLSESLEYNEFGQPTLTRLLQREGNPARWIYTKTEYDPVFHQPSRVIEDYRYPGDSLALQHGVNRIQTTQYDIYGRPEYQATYAANGTLVRRLQTVYDPVTEQVREVWRVAANGTRQRLASYTYTPGGRLLTATDYLSNVTTEVDYYAQTWQTREMREWWGDQLRYKIEYFYAINGSGGDLKRKLLTVSPNSSQQQVYQWDYGNYLTGVTFPLQRAFTRVVMRGSGLTQPEVVDYLYDPQTMRLRAARFAVQPITNTQDPAYESGSPTALGINHPDNLGIPLYRQTPQSFTFAWYAYDGAGRLTELRYYLASLKPYDQRWGGYYNYASIGKFVYLDGDAPAYDEAGNRFLMTAYNGSGITIRAENYQYDAFDRLTRVNYGTLNNGVWQTWSNSWTYDVMGNRYGQGNPAYDGLNRLTQFGGVALQHDLLGNRLQDGRYTYQWDVLDRLIGMQAYQRVGRFVVLGDSWRFRYRVDGLRISKELQSVSSLEGTNASPRTDYLYDGSMPVCEQDFQGGVLRQSRIHFLGGRGIEALITVDHTLNDAVTLQWCVYDGHGNLVRLLLSNGAPDQRGWQWRGVWGEVQGSPAAGRGYCANLGHPEDETGLVYMRARYYEPATGRFISEDPARDGVNWYLYADGNPVMKVDFEGKMSRDDIVAFIGNTLIVIGFLLLGGISLDAESLKSLITDQSIEFGLSALGDQGEIATLVKFAIELANLAVQYADTSQRGALRAQLYSRWAGYYTIIWGQILLTEMDLANPGYYDWWGWEVVSHPLFP